MRFVPAIITIAALACSDSVTSTAPQFTFAREHHEWTEDFNQPWQDVLACWAVNVQRPDVLVMDICDDNHYFTDSWGREVHGFTLEDTVVVCPDLAGLRHEMSHYVSWVSRGHYGEHVRGGCFDVR